MSGTISASKPTPPPAPRVHVHIRAAELVSFAGRASTLSAADVLRLIGEVWRLRAKVRGLKARIRDLEGLPFEIDIAAGRRELPPAPELTPAVEEVFGP